MVSIQIQAPEYPLEIHRQLSQRVIRTVAETYQCTEGEILLAIVVKAPTPAADTLRDHAQENAETIHAAVMSAVAAFRGEEAQDDDITLVVVKAT